MAKVYVGTYKKYNAGNLSGKWISLDNCDTYNDFLNKCKKAHLDECDPEFMIQDSEDFPDGLDCGEWIDESEFNDVKAAQNGENNFQIIDYSDNAIAVIGDTKSIKNALKQLGGRFNYRLSCGPGWIFSKTKIDAVRQLISTGNTEFFVNTKPIQQTNKFVEWLKEFAEQSDEKEYYLKNHVGAIKFDNGYYLIDKQHIENSFCFADEGPEYDFYKSLCADNNKMEKYFLQENRSTFKNRLDYMKKNNKLFLVESKNNKIINCQIPVNIYQEQECNGTEATPEQRKLYIEGITFGLQQLDKRLNAYLKRYGVSKLHTWSYWRDA